MEDNKNNIYDRVIVNNDRDFIENDREDISANYIVLCEENYNNEFNRPIYDNRVLGLSLAEWVSLSCEINPVILKIGTDEKLLDVIKPYLDGREYTVVLYADTPLVSKSHLKDLLGYVSRKRLNVCKLKRGYILKNEYVSEVDEIYSSLVYDIESNDFFEVKTYSDLDKVREILENNMFNHLKKNGVIFKNQKNTTIDANVIIGSNAVIGSNVSLLKNSVIGENVLIESNVVIDNSNLENNVQVGSGAIISNSVVKSNTMINTGTIINKSVIKQSARVGVGCVVVKSAVNENVVIDNFTQLENANLLAGSRVGTSSVIVGDGVVVAVEENSEILSGTKIIKRNS